MGHILTGLLILVVVFGDIYYAYQSDVLSLVFGGEDNQIVTSILKGFSGLTGQVRSASSTYAGKLEIGFLSLGSGTEKFHRFGIRAAQPTGPISVTGWRVETELGRKIIPRAVDLYGPGARRSLQNIVLNTGDELQVFTPLEGQNARVSGKEWRVFFEDPFLAYPHGTITLRDAEGKVVDVYKY